MAVTGRERVWRTALQRGIDTAGECADVAAQKINALADPRSRLLRKRRRAWRFGLFFVVACVFWVVVTLVMATWTVPFWALLIPGLIAAGAAAPATLLLLRYRWLKGEPLPPPRPGAKRRLPPRGSAARGAIIGLNSAERSMFQLLGVIERGEILPDEEMQELTRAANSVGATMTATADDVVSMEKAVAASPSSRVSLAPAIQGFAAQLDQGVAQYTEMVGAASQLVAAANDSASAGFPMSRQRQREELIGATDRLLGWAHGFEALSHTSVPRG